MEIYNPKEDSFMMESFIKENSDFFVGNTLEMGFGSGILSKVILTCPGVKNHFALDINPDAVSEFTKQKESNVFSHADKLSIYHSNLFSALKDQKFFFQFDTMIFNPPYLPFEEGEDKETETIVAGGKHGYELSAEFVLQAKSFLKLNGSIYIIVSSLARPEEFNKILFENGYQFKILKEDSFFFEKLFIYKITFHTALQEIAEKYSLSMNQFQFLTRGKKGLIFTTEINGSKVAIKCHNLFRKDLDIINDYLSYEGSMLKKMNVYNIGPKIIDYDSNYLIYHYIPGIRLGEFLNDCSDNEVIVSLQLLLLKMFLMDKLSINKDEMTNPYKHIFIEKIDSDIKFEIIKFEIADMSSVEEIVSLIETIESNSGIHLKLLDFERSKETLKPKNVTQVIQYILGGNITEILKKRNVIAKIFPKDLVSELTVYKNDFSLESFIEIIKRIFI